MKKEPKEWMQSWCDDTNEHDLPRVLLVGDSITRGYQAKVRELLAGVCRVDYISTSYAIDSPIYNKILKVFAADSEYALIHFNHGLHGIHMWKRTYKSGVKKLLETIGAGKKVVLATSTVVYHPHTKRKHGAWMKRVRERNEAVRELALEKGYAIDDLYTASVEMPFAYHIPDGFHYRPNGYDVLANAVVESIKKALEL